MDSYYDTLRDSGINVFRSRRRQHGGWFFGRHIKSAIMPLLERALPFVKRQLLDTATDTIDLIEKGDTPVQAIKKSAVKRGFEAVETGIKKIGNSKEYKRLKNMEGEGRKRKKRCCKKRQTVF